MKAKKSVTLILLLLLASCSSSSSRSDEVLYQKISEANELVIAVDKAIYISLFAYFYPVAIGITR
jgi:hypothetical protein